MAARLSESRMRMASCSMYGGGGVAPSLASSSEIEIEPSAATSSGKAATSARSALAAVAEGSWKP